MTVKARGMTAARLSDLWIADQVRNDGTGAHALWILGQVRNDGTGAHALWILGQVQNDGTGAVYVALSLQVS